VVVWLGKNSTFPNKLTTTSMNKSNLIKLFCLEGLLLDKMEINEKDINLFVRSPRTHAFCLHCEKSTNRVHKQYFRKIKHAIFNNKLIMLNINLKYFKCKKCNSVFCENIPGIDARRTSAHFRKSIIPKLKDRSFRAVAKEHGISTSSLINNTVSLINENNIIWPVGKFMLGIDEHSFSGRNYMVTVTDLTNHKILTILKNDNKSTIRQFLKKIPENIRKNIICVCSDMRRMYYNLAKEELNNIPVVIDKFHVIQFFNWHLNQLRQIYTSSNYPLPKKLLEKNKEDLTKEELITIKQISKKYPPIQELWRLKEFVRSFYNIKNKQKAELTFKVILDGLEFDNRPRWQSIHKTLIKWQKEMLNYFEYNITNAYTEGVHTRIKLLKRISYGFKNRTNYIAKMTLAFLPITILLKMMECSPSLT